MPRISVRGNGEEVTLTVTGALIGPWVDKLKRCWQMVQSVRKERALRIDVHAVTNISPDAREFLGQIAREGTRFVSDAPPSNAFVDELIRRTRGRVVAKRDLNERPPRTTEHSISANGRPRTKNVTKSAPGHMTV